MPRSSQGVCGTDDRGLRSVTNHIGKRSAAIRIGWDGVKDAAVAELPPPKRRNRCATISGQARPGKELKLSNSSFAGTVPQPRKLGTGQRRTARLFTRSCLALISV